MITKPHSEAPRDVLDLAFDAIFVRELDSGRITYWNQGAADVYGWPAEAAVGEVAADLLETRYPENRRDIEEALLRDGLWEGVLEQRSRTGALLAVRARWRLQHDAGGRPQSVVEIHGEPLASANVSRVKSDVDLLQLLVHSVKDYAIFLLDANGNVATWNEGAARIKGYRASEIVGRHFSTFYPDADVRSGKPDWELVAAAREGRFEDEGWRVRKDGSLFWANVVITALFDDEGQLRGYAKVTRDMTDRRAEEERQLDQEREKANQAREYAERMAQLEKVKGEFLNLASHELRGPLTVISGYLSLLEDGSIGTEKLPAILPTMIGKVRQIEGLVEQMLETARLEDGKLALAMEKVDLRAVVEKALESKRVLLSAEHRLKVDLPSDPIQILGDPARLEIVIGNLLDNAIKYSPAGGTVRVTLTESPTRAFVSVQDEGIGISSDDVRSLFTRFGRVAGPEHSNISGTGLGLYLSRELVRRHGGEILVESKLGRGSRFTAVLPKP